MSESGNRKATSKDKMDAEEILCCKIFTTISCFHCCLLGCLTFTFDLRCFLSLSYFVLVRSFLLACLFTCLLAFMTLYLLPFFLPCLFPFLLTVFLTSSLDFYFYFLLLSIFPFTLFFSFFLFSFFFNLSFVLPSYFLSLRIFFLF